MRSIAILVALLLATGCGDETSSSTEGGSGGQGGQNGTGAGGGATQGSGGTTNGSGGAGDGGSAGAGGGATISSAIRFYGNGGIYGDRVLIPLDDPSVPNDPSPTADIGAGDFTIEFWMKAQLEDNTNGFVSCGENINWINGNIIIDRDRHNQPPKFGLAIAGGGLVFGVTGPFGGDLTICGVNLVLTGSWHHVAMQRRASDGRMWILVDGVVDAVGDGPPGDISYPDDGVPLNVCPGGLCDYSDPFLALGAEKHGYEGISYNGLMDELRLSNNLRYGTLSNGMYSVPTAPFSPDANTMALYHFDETMGTTTEDASGNGNLATLVSGGDPEGPQWAADSPF